MAFSVVEFLQTISINPLQVSSDCSVAAAIALMAEAQTDRAPLSGCIIVRTTTGIQGIFTEKDVVRLVAQGANLATLPIATVSVPVMCLHSSEVQNACCLKNLLGTNIPDYICVLDDQNKLLGLLTREMIHFSINSLDCEQSCEYKTKLGDSFFETQAKMQVPQTCLPITTVLKQGQMQFQLVMDALPAAIAYADAQERFLFVNQTYTEWLNLPREAIIGRTSAEILGEQYHSCKPAIEQVLLGQQCIHEMDFLTTDGTNRHVSGTLVPDFSLKNQVQGYYYLLTDITHHKQIETNLKNSEHFFRSLFEQSAFGIAFSRLDTPMSTPLQINPKLCQMLGYTIEELLRKNFTDIVHPEDLPKSLQLLRGLQAGRYESYVVECRYQRKDGSYFWSQTSVSLLEGLLEYPKLKVILIDDITSQKQAELAFIKSNERLRLALEVSGAIAWERNLETDMVIHSSTMNMAIPKMMTYPESLAVVHPDDREKMKQAYKGAIAERGSCQLEHRLLLLNPNTQLTEDRWFQVQAKVICDEHRQPIKIIGMSVDITEQKAIEHKLRQNEAMLQESQRIANVGSWEFDAVTAKLDWSEGMFTMFGLDPTEPEPSFAEYQDMLSLETNQELQRKINHALLYGIPYTLNYTARLRDGSIRHHEAKAKVKRNDYGEVIQLYGTVVDVTERETLILALQESQAELADIQNSVAGVISRTSVFKDGGWRLEYISEGCELITGFRSAELLADQDIWGKRIVPDDWQNIQMPLNADIFTEQSGTYEYRFLDKHGQLRWFSQTHHSRWDERQDCWSVTMVILDVSDRKAVEQELIFAKEAAEAAAAAKAMFLANMSHEIRTPMNGVIGMLNLLGDAELNHKEQKQLQVAQSSAQSLLTLINDILDFSKIDAGKLELEEIDFDLHQQLGDFAKAIAIKAQEKGIELILDLQEVFPCMVKGDPNRLRQILTNLVGNAIKFTERGEIQIKCHLGKENNGSLWFTGIVQDTGIGIPADKLSSLFSPFTQADVSTTRRYGGTGLGLAITHRLCELMGGRITVVSTEGVGSRFAFKVRFQKSNQPLSNGFLPSNLRDFRVLVVAENLSLCETLTRQLKTWGATVETAHHANAALTVCRAIAAENLDAGTLPFDAILISQGILQDKGEAINPKILADPLWQKMPLIILSDFQENRQYLSIKGFPISTFLAKPVAPLELLETLITIQAKQFSFPAVTATNSTSDHEIKTENQYPWTSNTRLLSVDDNPVNHMVLSGLLERVGLKIDIALNGVEAIKKLKQSLRQNNPYDLIFMDCLMPQKDGFVTTGEIRQGLAGSAYQSTPIIAMTANAMKGDREKCLAAGMDDYLSKPLKSQYLVECLEAWLSSEDSAQNNAQTKPTETHDSKAELSETFFPTWASEVLMEYLDVDNGNLKFAIEVCQAFLKEAPNQIQVIHEAIGREDFDSCRYKAHSLKGVSGLLGGKALYQCALELERAAEVEDIALLRTYLAEVKQQFSRLKQVLETWINEQNIT